MWKWIYDKNRKEYYTDHNPNIRADKDMNVYGGGGSDVQAPQPTAEEKALQQAQLDMLNQSRSESDLMKPFLLQSLGLVQEGTGYRRMTDEERIAQMSPTEKSNYDILQLQQQRQLAALQGNLPVSPALEQDIAKQEATMNESLSRQLGSGWATTTSGIQAKSQFDQRAEALREAARRDEMTTGEGLMLSQEGYMTGSNQAQQQAYTGYGQRLFPLIQGYGQAQQPYQYNRGLEMQANQLNAQSNSSALGGLGSLFGSAASAYGSYAGLATIAASDRRLKTNLILLDNVNGINIYSFNYLANKGLPKEKQIGVIAQDILSDYPNAVMTMKDDYYGVIYTNLPIEVRNRIQTLREEN